MNKRTLLILGAVCVLVVAGFFALKSYSETRIQNEIEAFLANLPEPLKASAEKIEVSLGGKSVNLVNLKGSYVVKIKESDAEKTALMDFSIDRVEAKGINMDGFKAGAGIVKLFDSLTFRNTAFYIPNPVAKANIEFYHLEDISCDAEKLAKELSNTLPSLMVAQYPDNYPNSNAEAKKLFTDLKSLLLAYETLKVGRIVCENYTYSLVDFQGNELAMALGRSEIKDSSIRKTGPISMANLNIAFDGSPLMAIESIGADGFILPSFVPFFDSMISTDFVSPEVALSALKGQVFSLQNLRLKGLTIPNPKVSFANLIFSYTSETDHLMDLGFNGLNFQKSLLLEELQLSSEEILSSLPETISLEGGWQQTVSLKEQGLFNLDCKRFFLKGPGVGEASVSIAADNISTIALMMTNTPGDVLLKGFDIFVKDEGFSELAFAMNDPSDPAKARADEVASLHKEIEKEASPIAKELLNGIIKFLEKPNSSIHVKFSPQKPLDLGQLAPSFFSMEPAAIGLSVNIEQID